MHSHVHRQPLMYLFILRKNSILFNKCSLILKSAKCIANSSIASTNSDAETLRCEYSDNNRKNLCSNMFLLFIAYLYAFSFKQLLHLNNLTYRKKAKLNLQLFHYNNLKMQLHLWLLKVSDFQ